MEDFYPHFLTTGNFRTEKLIQSYQQTLCLGFILVLGTKMHAHYRHKQPKKYMTGFIITTKVVSMILYKNGTVMCTYNVKKSHLFLVLSEVRWLLRFWFVDNRIIRQDNFRSLPSDLLLGTRLFDGKRSYIHNV